jgi:hypothetical protein
MMLLDIDPNVVKPGWTPLIITILLAVTMVLLYISMRRQFRKIHLPDEQASTSSDPAAAPSARRD